MKVTPCITEREMTALLANAPVREFLVSEDETPENYLSSEEEAPGSDDVSDTSEPDEYGRKKTVKTRYNESSDSSIECLSEILYKDEKRQKPSILQPMVDSKLIKIIYRKIKYRV